MLSDSEQRKAHVARMRANGTLLPRDSLKAAVVPARERINRVDPERAAFIADRVKRLGANWGLAMADPLARPKLPPWLTDELRREFNEQVKLAIWEKAGRAPVRLKCPSDPAWDGQVISKQLADAIAEQNRRRADIPEAAE